MTTLSTDLLTWTPEERRFTGELSTVTRGGRVRLTETVTLRNPKTGGTRDFRLSRRERDRENDLVALHFVSDGRTARGMLHLTLYND